MMWKRESTTGLQELPEQRKALAERYTIDAEEAQRREQTAAEQAARRAAEEEAARSAAEEEEARQAAAIAAAREAEEWAQRAATAHLERGDAPEPSPSAAEPPQGRLVLP